MFSKAKSYVKKSHSKHACPTRYKNCSFSGWNSIFFGLHSAFNFIPRFTSLRSVPLGIKSPASFRPKNEFHPSKKNFHTFLDMVCRKETFLHRSTAFSNTMFYYEKNKKQFSLHKKWKISWNLDDSDHSGYFPKNPDFLDFFG